MVSYLVHLNQNLDSPIQCKILQQYANLIENYLPISMIKNNQLINILDLTDSNLGLFLGISQFKGTIIEGIIDNGIIENYIGKTNNKNYGKQLIGKLISITDIEKNSILDSVKDYGFNSIRMNENIKNGTQVIVSCYGLPNHPQVASMNLLQKTRKLIVKKIEKNKGKIN